MSRFDFVVSCDTSISPRLRQIEGMFNVPLKEKQSLRFSGAIPHEDKEWSIGLIVGPSGSGKTSVSRKVFGDEAKLSWDNKKSVIDNVNAPATSEIADAFNSVGFSTIPAWTRPFSVLSNGERFRAEVARILVESKEGVIVIDEFTSVVDRQVARVASHSVQKYVRSKRRKLVAVSCHYDIVDWLQPDWVYEPHGDHFQWRSVRRRPEINCEIQRVDRSAWNLFMPFHYMSGSLSSASSCFVLFADGQPSSFCATNHFPHPRVRDIKVIHRIVTHPDFQGLGLAFALSERLGAAYSSLGYRLRNYPSHPGFVRAHDRSNKWKLIERSRQPCPISRKTSLEDKKGVMGKGRRSVFEYVGPKSSECDAAKLLKG